MHCPQCNNILQNFKDSNFPQQIRLSFCPKCMGFWLNRGELTEYKNWQNTKKTQLKSTTNKDNQELKGQMDSFLAGAKENNYETLGALGNLLNQQATCTVTYKNDSLPVVAEILLNMVGWIFFGLY